jgi:acetate kinase
MERAMTHAARQVLAINGGSSSIKFALFDKATGLQRRMHGIVDRIGVPGTTLAFARSAKDRCERQDVGALDRPSAVRFLIDWLERTVGFASIDGVGHRVVNGGLDHVEPARVSDALLADLRRISAYTPEHLPAEIALIETFRDRLPGLAQVACFDTAFHRTLPNVARTLAVPRRLQAKGVARYGFHGLSYAYVMDALAASVGPQAAQGRLVLAHLGNGASLTAVHRGRSVDTSMAFTPAAGIPMSTRAGDLDPGLVLFLARTERMTAEAFHRMVNHESGLLGVSETSGDVRDLLARESSDSRAAEALALFCYQVKKWIGAFAAALGGIDCMVFTGGIGEHAAPIRERICEGLGFLGIEIDGPRNAAQAPRISPDRGRVDVRIIATDEEIMIAKAVDRLLRSGVREA